MCNKRELFTANKLDLSKQIFILECTINFAALRKTTCRVI